MKHSQLEIHLIVAKTIAIIRSCETHDQLVNAIHFSHQIWMNLESENIGVGFGFYKFHNAVENTFKKFDKVDMSFGKALDILKNGGKITREKLGECFLELTSDDDEKFILIRNHSRSVSRKYFPSIDDLICSDWEQVWC